MKKSIFLMALLMSAIHVTAQSIGACLLGTTDDGKRCWVSVSQKADAEKDGQIYMSLDIVVISCSSYYLDAQVDVITTASMFIRQEAGKTFRYDETNGNEVVIMDMTLEEGDVFVRPNGETLSVEKVETDADDVKIIYLKGTDSNVEDIWRSDIGSVKSGLLQVDDISGVTIDCYQDNGYWVSGNRNKYYYPETNNEVLKQISYYTEKIGSSGGSDLDFSFEGDSLHIKGMYSFDGDGSNYQVIQCIIEGNNIYLNFVVDKNHAPKYGHWGYDDYYYDLKIGGFKTGIYSIYNMWISGGRGIQAICGDVDYRPFVEEGKVWKVGQLINENTTARVQYYYFDGDTVIDGRKCKRMMCYTQCAEEYPLYDGFLSLLNPVAALYENQREVYIAYYSSDNPNEVYLEPRPLYDFGLASKNSSLVFGDRGYGNECEVKAFSSGYRSTDRFKGHYIEFQMVEDDYSIGTWLEGVGSEGGPLDNGLLPVPTHYPKELMECRVGDEVIYHNPDIIDGVNPPDEETKKRIDFTHIQKPRPKAPHQEAEAEGNQLSGAYTLRLLDLDLGTMSDTYHVTITDDTGETVYDKTVRAADVLALNINISEWTAPNYTITVENDYEQYIGTFELTPTSIEEKYQEQSTKNNDVYDLQGRRVIDSSSERGGARRAEGSLPKGLYIKGGRKYLKR